MAEKKLKILYEDNELIVYDKPPGICCDNFPFRVHRLDKDTSGIFLVAKDEKALTFFQEQFKKRLAEKKYLALIVGHLKNEQGTIKTLLGRSSKDRRKQKVFLTTEPQSKGKREAITEYRTLEKFKDFSLIEVVPKTGRKHQIRIHFAYLGHPVAGDKLYGFKNQINPEGISHHFLHATYLKIKLPNGEYKEFHSPLPYNLKNILKKLKKYE